MLIPTLLALVLLALAGVLLGVVRRIPEGQVYSLSRFGRPAGILDTGLHVVWPLAERVTHKISLAGRTLQLEQPDQDRALRGRLYWQVLEPERIATVMDQAEALLRSTTAEVLAAEPELASASPEARNAHAKQALNQRMRQHGMLVTRVEIETA